MRDQDKKAILTKALNRHLGTSTIVKKVKIEIAGHPIYEVVLTPNSNMLLTYTLGQEPPFINRVSIPRFSDWIVESGAYESVTALLWPPKPKEKA